MEMKRGEKFLTEPFFFDNDCIAAFLWINEQSLLAQLYPGRIIIPKPVYDELSFPGVTHLKKRIDQMISSGQAEIRYIDAGSPTYDMYYAMTQEPENGHKIIGDGEAACLALAKSENGIVASNNLKDISTYIKELSLAHITTGEILVEALHRGLITEEQGNTLWAEMLKKRRKLGASSFSEFLTLCCSASI